MTLIARMSSISFWFFIDDRRYCRRLSWRQVKGDVNPPMGEQHKHRLRCIIVSNSLYNLVQFNPQAHHQIFLSEGFSSQPRSYSARSSGVSSVVSLCSVPSGRL